MINRNMMRNAIRGLAVFAVLGLTSSSCEKGQTESTTARDLMLTSTEMQKAGQDNAFAFALFKLATADLDAADNALLSPLSLSMALAMTANGAVGDTKAAIYEALSFNGFEEEQINAYYQKLIADLPQLDPKTTLDIANSIWYRQGLSVLPAFLGTNTTFYDAEVTSLDFADPGAVGRINQWASDHTNGKIPTVIDRIPEETIMYLLNAVYFKGNWSERFEVDKTSKRDFTRAGGVVVQTDFMHANDNYKVYRSEDIDAIELPYGDGKYSMVVVKSNQGQQPAQVLDALTSDGRWAELSDNLYPAKTQLWLPKFKYSYERNLNDDLSTLGMGLAFTDQADFTGLEPSGKATISSVKQNAFIEVNEAGTEAAAVTVVEVGVTSMPMIFTFDANQPFLYLIRETSTGLILFIGQVNDPTSEQTKG